MSTAITRRGTPLVAAAIISLLAMLAMAPQAGATTYYACVKKNGAAHIYTKKPKCRRGESKLSWNSRGPAGRNGKNGANGANGKNGASGANGANGTNALVTPLLWHELPLENGWTAYPAPEFGGTPEYTKDAEGFVHFTGALYGEAKTSKAIATLPVGFRPHHGAWVAVGNSNGAFNPFSVNLWITAEGAINVENGEKAVNNFVSLEGVEFFVG
jgi:hypothetical protein